MLVKNYIQLREHKKQLQFFSHVLLQFQHFKANIMAVLFLTIAIFYYTVTRTGYSHHGTVPNQVLLVQKHRHKQLLIVETPGKGSSPHCVAGCPWFGLSQNWLFSFIFLVECTAMSNPLLKFTKSKLIKDATSKLDILLRSKGNIYIFYFSITESITVKASFGTMPGILYHLKH